jgi:hypothetical protein
MNKNILLIAGVGVAYWYYRNQQSQQNTSPTTGLTTGAVSYLPTTTANGQPVAAGSTPSWLSNTAGTIATAGTIVKTGISLWDTVQGDFNTATAPIKADVTADSSSGGLWSGQYPVS